MSCLTLVILWTVACQAPLSVGFPRQEHWSGLLFSSPGNLPDPRIEPMSPALQADSLPLNHLGSPNLPINLGISEQITNNNSLLTLVPEMQAVIFPATADIRSGRRDWNPISTYCC